MVWCLDTLATAAATATATATAATTTTTTNNNNNNNTILPLLRILPQNNQISV
jgi:hypothetical protein